MSDDICKDCGVLCEMIWDALWIVPSWKCPRCGVQKECKETHADDL